MRPVNPGRVSANTVRVHSQLGATAAHEHQSHASDPFADAINEAAVVSPQPTADPNDPRELARRQERAERLIAEYESLRPDAMRSLAAILRARRLTFATEDLEEFYNSAWFALYQYVLSGEQVDNPGGWLVNAMKWRAFGEVRRRNARPRTVAGGADYDRDGPIEPDYAGEIDQRALIRNWRFGLRTRLSRTERKAAVLRLIRGYSRIEIAEILEIDRDKADKLMDAIHAKTRDLLRTLDEGDVCAEHRSLISAYAYGVLDPDGERYAAARQHVLECPACTATVRALRNLPLILPVPALAGVMSASGGSVFGMLGGLFKGTTAGAAGAGAGGAGAGATGGLLAGGAAVKGVAAGLCALCGIGGLAIYDAGHSGTTAATAAKPRPPVSAKPHTPPAPTTVPTTPPAQRSADPAPPAPRPHRQPQRPARRTSPPRPPATPSAQEFSFEHAAPPAPAATTPAQPDTTARDTSPPDTSTMPQTASEFSPER
jgi:DNA-directed RNA polymerase specialized sigma24 family protein